MKQKLVRIYPDGYTSNGRDELDVLFNNGWIVVHITIMTFKDNRQHSDYILQKTEG